MSSVLLPPQPSLASLRQDGYGALIMLTAIGYDYVLTFSKEIKYIWCKPWTWVSTLFILVRYAGLYTIAIHCLCKNIYVISAWTFILFLGASDFVMTLRVWAMYSRSRLILCILLTTLFVEIISYVLIVINDVTRNLSVVTTQIHGFSFCVSETGRTIPWKLAYASQTIHGAVACILAIAQFVRQSLQMYHATKQWQINPYMSLLIREGIFYFLAIFALNLFNILYTSELFDSLAEKWNLPLLFFVGYVPLFTLAPRFIISIRELYAHDVRGRCGEGIDTGFGLLSTHGHGAGGIAIVFADNDQNKDIEEMSSDVGTPPQAV